MYVVLYNLEYTPPLIIRRAKNRRDGLYAVAYIRENTVFVRNRLPRVKKYFFMICNVCILYNAVVVVVRPAV